MFLKNKKDKKPDPLSRYEDVTSGYSNRELRISQWYLQHKFTLQKIGMGVLIAWCVLSVGGSLIAWGMYLFSGYQADVRLQQSLVQSFRDDTALRDAYSARDLQVRSSQFFSVGTDRYTFAAFLHNPNVRHVARVSYRFVYRGGTTAVNEAVVLPGIERPVAVFGHGTDILPTEVRFVIESVDWSRIDPHKVADPALFIADRVQFSVDNFVFEPGGVLSDIGSDQIGFDITNDTVYSYFDPEFHVAYYDGTVLLGLVNVVIEPFPSNTTEQVDLRSIVPLGTVTGVQVFPAFDIFDPQEFMAPLL